MLSANGLDALDMGSYHAYVCYVDVSVTVDITEYDGLVLSVGGLVIVTAIGDAVVGLAVGL